MTAGPGAGPWRVLILDRGDDTKWMIATIVLPSDVRPAQLGAGHRYAHWDDIPDWVHAQTGEALELSPVQLPLVWSVRPRSGRVDTASVRADLLHSNREE